MSGLHSWRPSGSSRLARELPSPLELLRETLLFGALEEGDVDHVAQAAGAATSVVAQLCSRAATAATPCSSSSGARSASSW